MTMTNRSNTTIKLNKKASKIMKVTIAGPGCSKCHQTEKTVKEVLSELDVDADVEHVSDFQKFVQMGVRLTPAVVVDDEIKISGRVPSRNEIKQLFQT